MTRLLTLTIIFLFLTGCASLVAPPYTPDYTTIDKVKKENLQKLSVGEFQPKEISAPVNKISLRGSSLKAKEGAFSTYIENAMRSDLGEMGFYDAASKLKLEASLLKNDIDVSGLSKGTGEIEVKLKVMDGISVKFDKNYMVNTSFESSFAGAVAIPIGQREYPNLVKALLQKIYLDMSFIEAIKNDGK